MLMHVELIETERGSFTVVAGEKFADRLGRDEALGVLAALLFGGVQALPYMRTYDQWLAWHRRYCAPDIQEPVALLSWYGRAH